MPCPLLLAVTLGLLGAPPAAAQAVPAARGTWLPGTLEIHHIYVGQGDSVLVVSPTGRTLLYDVGERDWFLHENAELVSQYVERVTGKRELDYVVLSHYHQDHVGNSKRTEDGAHYDGGIFWLLTTRALTIRKVLDRGFEPLLPRTPIAVKYKAFAESPEGKVLLAREAARLGKGQIDLGAPVSVRVVAVNGKALDPNGREVVLLTPEQLRADPPPSENDLSLCLTIRWGEFEYFIGGDLSGQDMVSPYGYKYHDIETGVAEAVGNVEVYRANHHGSDHSSNATFIRKLDPEVSIVSSGTANRFGHPRQPVVDGLHGTSDVFVTAREGGASSSRFGRAAEGGNVVVRVYHGGYSYDVAVVRTYRSFDDADESRHRDQVLDYEQQQVRYEEASGPRKPDEDDEGSRSGDLKAGGSPGKSPGGGAAGSGAPGGAEAASTSVAEVPTARGGVPCVRARDRDVLQGLVGKRTCVWGRVTSTFTPASNKVKFLNIDTEDLANAFTLVIFAKDWPSFLETSGIGDPCKFYRDKWVAVVGNVIAYEEKPSGKAPPALPSPEGAPAAKPSKLEIIVSAPHQIEVMPYRKEAPAPR